jgi:hypothetical protein
MTVPSDPDEQLDMLLSYILDDRFVIAYEYMLIINAVEKSSALLSVQQKTAVVISQDDTMRTGLALEITLVSALVSLPFVVIQYLISENWRSIVTTFGSLPSNVIQEALSTHLKAMVNDDDHLDYAARTSRTDKQEEEAQAVRLNRVVDGEATRLVMVFLVISSFLFATIFGYALLVLFRATVDEQALALDRLRLVYGPAMGLMRAGYHYQYLMLLRALRSKEDEIRQQELANPFFRPGTYSEEMQWGMGYSTLETLEEALANSFWGVRTSWGRG